MEPWLISYGPLPKYSTSSKQILSIVKLAKNHVLHSSLVSNYKIVDTGKVKGPVWWWWSDGEPVNATNEWDDITSCRALLGLAHTQCPCHLCRWPLLLPQPRNLLNKRIHMWEEGRSRCMAVVAWLPASILSMRHWWIWSQLDAVDIPQPIITHTQVRFEMNHGRHR